MMEGAIFEEEEDPVDENPAWKGDGKLKFNEGSPGSEGVLICDCAEPWESVESDISIVESPGEDAGG